MNVIIPIATKEPKFEKGYHNRPRPLVTVAGCPLIKWVTECVGDIEIDISYTFVVLESHIYSYNIDKYLKDIFHDDIDVVSVSGETDGAARTVLEAESHISDNGLLILLGDQYIEMNLHEYISERSNVDGLIPIFKSNNPAWSYAATSRGRVVSRVAEKKVISSNATAGAYYFANGLDFVIGAKRMVDKGITTNGLFYVCPVYNELIEMSKRVEVMPVKKVRKLSSPADVRQFESYITKR